MSRRRGRPKGRSMHTYYGHANDYVPPNYNGYNVKRGWNTGDEPQICTNCDYTPLNRKQTILIDYETWKVIMGICTVVKVEWQALLKGTVNAKGEVVIDGYYIPKQQVTPSSVKNLDVIDDEFIAAHRIVAGVHSHANMACFFSQTDVEHTNMSLIKHNIVVNNKSEYKAQSRIELPCGMVKFIEAEVFTVGSSDTVIVGIENIVQNKPLLGFNNNQLWNLSNGAITERVVENGKKYTDFITDGMRWCPVCSHTPEEDQGCSCVCWTKNKRKMLPDFTLANYERTHGKSYELKYPLDLQYVD